MNDQILDEQINYYRARAQEYDESIADAAELLKPARRLLLELGRFDAILELACGTGMWTEVLLGMGQTVTAVDAAPEMLDRARQKLGVERIQYQQADLFHWEPEQKYDLVFFANWLSHVPPDALDGFLEMVRRAVKPGGQIAILDQGAPSDSDRAIARDEIYAQRPLEDGRQFMIVKVFYDLDTLRNRLERLGFEISIRKVADTFFFLVAKEKLDL